LNDQFRFIGSAAFDEYSRQKYSEDVVEAVGDIGIAVTKHRELGTPGSRWAYLLTSLFEDSLEFDLTAAAHISIKKLGRMSTIAILKGDIDSYRSYSGQLGSIADICVSTNHTYPASLLQSLHRQYALIYAAFIRGLCVNGYAPEYDVSSLLETFAESFNEAKSNYGYYNQQVLFAGLFGMQPFAEKIRAEMQRHGEIDPRAQRYLVEYLSELIDFIGTISHQDVEANDSDLYIGYTQFLFLLENVHLIDEDKKHDLLLQLNTHWIKLIEETYSNAFRESEDIDRDLNKRISDFYAIVIYSHREEPEILSEFIEPFDRVYNRLSDEYETDELIPERNLRSLYSQLKLIGAWTHLFHDIKEITPELLTTLTADFREIESTNSQQIPRTAMEKYRYPSNSLGLENGWWLRPDAIWGNAFQERIHEDLDDADNYATFHEKLKGQSDLEIESEEK
jgi:hypothetical protein